MRSAVAAAEGFIMAGVLDIETTGENASTATDVLVPAIAAVATTVAAARVLRRFALGIVRCIFIWWVMLGWYESMVRCSSVSGSIVIHHRGAKAPTRQHRDESSPSTTNC